MNLWIDRVTYGDAEKRWLAASGHYLQNPPPGCLFAIGVRELRAELFADVLVASGPLLGLCLIGRPVARKLPQDGTVGEITRMVLVDGLPHGTASRVLRISADVAKRQGMASLIAYHDRTRHTGCIYRKAGFKKRGATTGSAVGWGNRKNRERSATAGATSKRRWVLDLCMHEIAKGEA